MGQVRPQDGHQGQEQGGPGGDVGVDQVIDVEPGPRGQGQVHQEDEAEHQECHQGLEPHQPRPEVREAAGDDLDVAIEAGDGRDGHEDEVEAGPQPAVAQGQEALVEDGHSGQPDVVPSLGVGEAGRGHREVGVSLLGGPKEAESEQDAEEDPDSVSDQHHGRVPDQVVSELVAPGQGGLGAEAELEAEHDVLGGLKPEAGLLEQPPVRREEGEHTLGRAISQASS